MHHILCLWPYLLTLKNPSSGRGSSRNKPGPKVFDYSWPIWPQLQYPWSASRSEKIDLPYYSALDLWETRCLKLQYSVTTTFWVVYFFISRVSKNLHPNRVKHIYLQFSVGREFGDVTRGWQQRQRSCWRDSLRTISLCWFFEVSQFWQWICWRPKASLQKELD